MKYDYGYLDWYYNELLRDIYEQPSDNGHIKNTEIIIRDWIYPLGITTVLDVGCGQGEAQIFFENAYMTYKGVALGGDAIAANLGGKNVYGYDFNFLPYDDNTFQILFSRHSLEHSPFPLITLMEWHRVSSEWLCVVLPNPEHYTYVGRNHYSVMGARQSAWILRRAGWKIRKYNKTQEEFWFLCKKAPRISYEGWATVPISRTIYEFERDMLEPYGEIDVLEYFGKRGLRSDFE